MAPRKIVVKLVFDKMSIGLRKATMRNGNVFFAHCQISAIAFSG
jgi:hypothetical protein